MARSTLRIYVLGAWAGGGTPTQLTILADFKDCHAVERVVLDSKRIEELTRRIRDLESHIINDNPSYAEGELCQLGQRLFDLVFVDKVKFILHRATPGPNDAALRPLQLVVEDPTIAAWPWEYAYDCEERKYLCRAFYPLCRGVFGVMPRDEPMALDRAIRVLVVLGASRHDPEADVEEERRRVEKAFERNMATINNTVHVQVDVVAALEPAELQAELLKKRYDILHFYGHAGFDAAKNEGYLTFDRTDAVNGSGSKAAPLKARIYAQQFGALMVGQHIQLAFLNACQTAAAAPDIAATNSSVAAALINEGVPAVIAAQFVMPDNNAHYFSASVYIALAQGQSVSEAMRNGRTAMMLTTGSKAPDWGIPVLYASYPDLCIFRSIPAQIG